MNAKSKAPKLMEFLFGEAAETAQQCASERLKRWSQAFEDWLEERHRLIRLTKYRLALLVWGQMLHVRRKPPYELTQEDIEAYMAWMQAQGYVPKTIAHRVWTVSHFYRWCSAKGIDADSPAGFNPAAGVQTPKIRYYRGAGEQPSPLLKREEVEALLELLKRDTTPLGKRDYAFILARLHTGVPQYRLQRLQWGQISPAATEVEVPDGGGAGAQARGIWVKWQPDAERQLLPLEVWDAIQSYLEASGRLAGMRAGEYIFAPLISSAVGGKQDQAGDWIGSRFLSYLGLLKGLKLYGRAVGIPEEKLTHRSLRLTAIRLRLNTGASLEAMRVFLDHQGVKSSVKQRLRCLQALPGDEEWDASSERKERPYPARVPDRTAYLYQPGDHMTHGLYAQSRPPEAVLGVQAENIQGLEAEILGLRSMARGLLHLQTGENLPLEAGRLTEAYTQAAARLAGMMEAADRLAGGEDPGEWEREFLAMLAAASQELGLEPTEGGEPGEAGTPGEGDPGRGEHGEAEDSAARVGAARQLAEEVAATRWVLRTTVELAGEAFDRCNLYDYIHLVEVYGKGCIRLVRLLQASQGIADGLTPSLQELIQSAIQEVSQELGIADK